jgi:hypothetical protein
MPEDIPIVGYSQFLGRIDRLGLLNSLGNPSPTLRICLRRARAGLC